MRVVLVALAAIVGAGVVVGVVAHLVELLGGTVAWMGPISPWLVYGSIFVSSLFLLSARDDTGLDTPGDSVR